VVTARDRTARDQPAPVEPALPGPAPGELLLDPAVPVWERLTVSRNGWSAVATHVWTGTAWARLVPGPVRCLSR
jgi:hypothetical protein